MKPYEIIITVTEKGTKYEISTLFPNDMPLGRIVHVLESTRDSVIETAARYFDANHQLSETEKQEIAETLTLRQIADAAKGN